MCVGLACCCCSCRCVTLVLICVGLVGSVVSLIGTNVFAALQTEEKIETWHWVVKNAPLVICFFIHLAALIGLVRKKRWLLLPYTFCAVICAIVMIGFLVMISKDSGQLEKTYVKGSMAELIGYSVFLLFTDVFVIYTFLTL